MVGWFVGSMRISANIMSMEDGVLSTFPSGPFKKVRSHGKKVQELFSENSSLRHIFSDFCGQIWWRLQNMPECVVPGVYC